MLHVLRVGCPWRDMHERYGKWNSVYVRFRRWAEQGVWDAMLQMLVDLGLIDDWQHMIDSTPVRGHVSAAGGKGQRHQWPDPDIAYIGELEVQATFSASALPITAEPQPSQHCPLLSVNFRHCRPIA